MATYTVGTGGDYPDLGTAWDTIDGTTLSEDLTFDIISSQTVSSWPASPAVICDGHTLTVTCSTAAGYHNGNPNTGYLITASVPINISISDKTEGTLVVEKLNIYNTQTSFLSVPYALSVYTTAWPAQPYQNGTNTIVRNIIVGNIGGYTYGVNIDAMYISTVAVYDLKIYNCERGLHCSAGVIPRQDRGIVENVTVYNCCGNLAANHAVNITDTVWYSVKNIVAVTDYAHSFSTEYASMAGVTFINCADSDGSLATVTATNPITVTSAAEFKSVTSTDATFLFLKDNAVGQLANGGVAPSVATTDIAGLAIPYSSNYPIGCHVSYVAPAATFPEMIIDSGAVYKNYGLDDEQLIGATRGGNRFGVDQIIEDMGYDGRGKHVKGGRRIVSVQPYIEANVIEVSPELIADALPASTRKHYSTYNEIKRALQIALADYCDNVAIVGEVLGKNAPIVCIIKNALCVSNFDMQNADGDEAVLTLKFAGHFDEDDLDTDPWEIRYPNA